MADERDPRAAAARRGRAAQPPPWLAPDAPSQWWSAAPPADRPRRAHERSWPGAADYVDGDVDGDVENDAPAPPPRIVPATPPTSTWAALIAWLRAVWRQRQRVAWGAALRRAAASGLVKLFILLLCAWLVVNVGQTLLRMVAPGGLHFGAAPAATAPARPSPTRAHTPLPTPTPLAQTELDGVITITNLDGQNPFEGDVQVLARDGAWFCRNAPLPKSTWHVRLEPGAALAIPCIIPAASPASLPAHTFRKTVSTPDGQGLALVDNPAPFAGALFIPTPLPTTAP